MKFFSKILFCLVCLAMVSCNYLTFAVEIEDIFGSNHDFVVTDSSSDPIVSGNYSYLIDSNEVYLIGYIGEEEIIEVPAVLDNMPVVGIYTECFSTAYNAKKIILPSSIKAIYQDAFINCRTLENIEIDSSNETYSSYNGIVYSKDFAYLVQCPEGKIGEVRLHENTFFICDYSFLNCDKITKVNIPPLVGYFGEGIGIAAFYNTSSLEEFELDSRNKYFEIYDGVLYELNSNKKEVLIKCPDTRATCIDIPSTVKKIADYAFYGCKNLIGPMNFPDNLETIGESAFANCVSLDGEILIPNTVTSIGKMAFYGCKNIVDLTLSNSITQIAEDCFGYCSSLREIIIPNSVETIASRAFFYCTSVESLTLGNSVKTIEDWAFDYLTSLKGDLIIPNSVTKIGEAAFFNCKSLDGYIVIGSGVTDIGGSAFYRAKNSKGIVFAGDVPAVTEYSFKKPDITYYYLEGKLGFDSTFIDKDLQIYCLNPTITYTVQDSEYKTVILDSYGLSVSEFDAPIIEGYNFAGWFYDEEYTKQYSFSDTFMNNTTLYAKLDIQNSIVFEKEEIILESGAQENIIFEYDLEEGSDISDIIWETSDENIATVENGVITALEKGEAIITAKYKNASDSLKLTVWKDENKLNILKESISLEIGDSIILDCDYHLINNGIYEDIVWSSSDENIVTVENGKLIAVSQGNAIVTASYQDVTDNVEVIVLRENELNIRSDNISTILKEGNFLQLEYDYYFNDNSTYEDIIWSSSDENIATVEGGKIVAHSEGIVTIQAKYKDVSSNINITVVKKDSFNFSKDTLKIENNIETYNLEYSWYSYDNLVSDIIWSSSNEEIVTVEDGILKIKSLGECIVTAMCGDAVDTIIIDIVKPNMLEFVQDEITVQYSLDELIKIELDYYFNDDATYNDITFSSSNENVVKIEENKFIQKGIGTVSITAKYGNLSDTIDIIIVPQDNISFNKLGYILKPNENMNIEYQSYLNNSDYEHIELTSSNEQVALVNADGTITTLQEGEAIITASYNDIKAQLIIVVSNQEYLKGDLNNDGKVNAIDASILLDIYKYNNATNIQTIIGDLNEDKRVNSIDSSMILDIHKNNI